MGQALRLLLIEDSQDDAELLLRSLRRSSYELMAQQPSAARSTSGPKENQGQLSLANCRVRMEAGDAPSLQDRSL